MSAGGSRTMRLPALDRKCAACGKPVPADSRFCPACGAEVKAAGGKQKLSPVAAVEALLSEANLLRVRQDWSGAEARCLDVLRLDPNNLLAHSLLGECYRDQGRLDDAAQWYQLALDLDPANPSLRTKLKEVEDDLARRLVGAVHASHSGPSPSGTQKLAGLPPTTWINGLWAALALFIIVAVILIAGQSGRRSGGETTTTVRNVSGSAGAGARKGPGPFVLPSQGFRPAQNSRTPLAPSQGTAPSTPGADSTAPPVPASGQSAPAGPPDSTVVSIVPDPPQSGATIVLAERQSAGEPVEGLRQRTVQNAYRAVYSLFSSNNSYHHLGVTVRLGASGPALFSGEIDRSAMDRLVDVGDYAQVLMAFTNVWWNPNLVSEAPSDGGQGSPAGPAEGGAQP